MGKNVRISRVACGKFFDLTKMYTLKETAEALAEANVYWDIAYVVHGVLGYNECTKKSTYLVTDVWDESRGQGEVRAYRWNVLSTGSFEYNEAQKAYKEAQRTYKEVMEQG